jgi:hypothetical protein
MASRNKVGKSETEQGDETEQDLSMVGVVQRQDVSLCS